MADHLIFISFTTFPQTLEAFLNVCKLSQKLQSCNDFQELIEKTREKQSQSLSEVSWLGRIIPVRNLNVRRVLMNLQDNKQVSEAANDQKLSMCESHLKEIIEAQQSLKDDFKDDAVSF